MAMQSAEPSRRYDWEVLIHAVGIDVQAEKGRLRAEVPKLLKEVFGGFRWAALAFHMLPHATHAHLLIHLPEGKAKKVASVDGKLKATALAALLQTSPDQVKARNWRSGEPDSGSFTDISEYYERYVLNGDHPNHLKSGHAIVPVEEWGVRVHNGGARAGAGRKAPADVVQAVILEMTPELHVRSKAEDLEVIKRFCPSLKGAEKRAVVKGTFRSELYPEGQTEGHLPTLIEVMLHPRIIAMQKEKRLGQAALKQAYRITFHEQFLAVPPRGFMKEYQ